MWTVRALCKCRKTAHTICGVLQEETCFQLCAHFLGRSYLFLLAILSLFCSTSFFVANMFLCIYSKRVKHMCWSVCYHNWIYCSIRFLLEFEPYLSFHRLLTFLIYRRKSIPNILSRKYQSRFLSHISFCLHHVYLR